MAACTFFGHRECPESLEAKLLCVLTKLITTQAVDFFYVGNAGQFDWMVRKTLRRLVTKYPQVRYAVVLAYIPGKKQEFTDFSDIMIPEGIESVPSRYAISWRNRWMLKRCDYVVTYITHTWGGAAQFAELAKNKVSRL